MIMNESRRNDEMKKKINKREKKKEVEKEERKGREQQSLCVAK